jgi:MOSC domain-containing protein YiiM
MPTLLSIQVAQARCVQINGRAILFAIHKLPISGAVPVVTMGLAGDE